jgi:hypothetical protein
VPTLELGAAPSGVNIFARNRPAAMLAVVPQLPKLHFAVLIRRPGFENRFAFFIIGQSQEVAISLRFN